VNSELLVSEIFHSFQGEGKTLGEPAIFLRLAVCNLACTWCDTKYTWDWKNYNYKEQVRRWSPEDVLSRIRDHANHLNGRKTLIITGGEPMLQQQKLLPVLEGLVWSTSGWRVEVETAGTILPGPQFNRLVHQFNVSPKLENSGNPLKFRRVSNALTSLARGSENTFKFVVSKPEDLDEVDDIVSTLVDSGASRNQVYIMPEGTTPEGIEEKTRLIAPHVIRRGYRLTTRLHVIVYGNQRGV